MPTAPEHQADLGPDTPAGISVSVMPALEQGSCYASPRFSVTDAARDLQADQLLLIAGELSAYHVSRVRTGELPSSLAARIVPSVNWADPSGANLFWLSPTQLLAADQLYTLGAIGWGTLLTCRVAPHEERLSRVWPPLAGPRSATHAVYCSESPLDFAAEEVELGPSAVRAQARPGIAENIVDPLCVFLRVAEPLPEGTVFVPPPELAGLPVEPSPLVHRSVPSDPAPSCAPGRLSVGHGCIAIADDRFTIHSAADALWSVRTQYGIAHQPMQSGRSWTITGLTPSSAEPVEVHSLDSSGTILGDNLQLQTTASAPHIVISEVLADAIGAEPAQEWVELYNDGRSELDLEGYSLHDSAGSTILPSVVVAPGQWLLVVTEQYREGSVEDVAPATGTALVRVDQLGKSGLSNAGEALELRTPDGTVVSRFPGVPKPKPGISVARAAASEPDDQARFGLHAEPGASPGATNVLR